MKLLRVALMALAAGRGVEAVAQTATPFENQATKLAAPCLNAKPSAETAQTAIAACDQVLVDLSILKQSSPNLSGHDLNVYLVVVSMAQSRVGSSYGHVDGVRSARVCERMEKSWDATAQLDAAASPGYAAMISDLVASANAPVSKCRSEFGMPAGARPLRQG